MLSEQKAVINGAGAAGIAIARLLLALGVKDIVLLDSKGSIYKNRPGLNKYKKEIAEQTNKLKIKGDLAESVKGRDVFIGVSKADLLNEKMIKSMNSDPIIFALANPDPEITPDKALAAGASIAGTGRSDFDNQINNALVFPGIFRGLLDKNIKKITIEMKKGAAIALAYTIAKPTKTKLLPGVMDKRAVKAIADSVKKKAG
jgi:malate dehydrogenase (oxaloacetate-decarboxylating)